MRMDRQCIHYGFRRSGFLAVLLLGYGFTCGHTQGAVDSVVPKALVTDPPTMENLGFRWYIEGDDNGNGIVEMTYRKKGAETWRRALPLLRVNREEVDRGHGGRLQD